MNCGFFQRSTNAARITAAASSGVFGGIIAVRPDGHIAFRHPSARADGVAALDDMLGGGIDRGTSTLVMGPAGSGKSALSTQYAIGAAFRSLIPRG